jgi:hypothetical protein
MFMIQAAHGKYFQKNRKYSYPKQALNLWDFQTREEFHGRHKHRSGKHSSLPQKIYKKSEFHGNTKIIVAYDFNIAFL